jgi:hypothetical protein
MNKLKSLEEVDEHPARSYTAHNKNTMSLLNNRQKGGANYVFFKRKNHKQGSRPFNENEYDSGTARRPQTQHKRINPQLQNLEHNLRLKDRLTNSSARSAQRDQFSDAGSVTSSTRRGYINESVGNRFTKNLPVDRSDAYSTLGHARERHNRSVEVTSPNNFGLKTDNTNDEVFQKLREKAIQKYTSSEEQSKALARIELLKKYVNSSNLDLLDKIKEKMTQDLLHYNKKRLASMVTSEALKKLTDSLKLHANSSDVMNYANNFIHVDDPS